VDLSKNFSWISPHTVRTNKKAINKIQEEATMAQLLAIDHHPPQDDCCKSSDATIISPTQLTTMRSSSKVRKHELTYM
jgi:nanoRNase/pAp phosphatase (c-di-AMP/oligoRNAs hydrolase)